MNVSTQSLGSWDPINKRHLVPFKTNVLMTIQEIERCFKECMRISNWLILILELEFESSFQRAFLQTQHKGFFRYPSSKNLKKRFVFLLAIELPFPLLIRTNILYQCTSMEQYKLHSPLTQWTQDTTTNHKVPYKTLLFL